MAMMDASVMTGDQVVIAGRVGRGGSRGLSPVLSVLFLAFIQTAAIAGQPDMVFDGGCLVAQSLDHPIEPGVGEPGDFFPSDAVLTYFHNVRHIDLDASRAKVSVANGPRHGTLVQLSAAEAAKLGVGVTSGPLYRYRPAPNYLGPDSAALQIELDGKTYKTHTKFYVVVKVGDNGYPAGSAAAKCEQSQPK